MSAPSRAASYSAVLRTPHALRTFSAALVGRLSYGIVFLSMTVALTQATGSYSLAGTAIALCGVGNLLLAPARAGLVDRYGLRRTLPPMAAIYAGLLAGLTAAAWGPGTPAWLLLLLTVAAGACAPPLGPVMRTLWSDLMPDQARRQRAFALDTVAEELLYVTGPLVAGLFITFGNPALGVAASGVLVLTGTVALVSSPAAGNRRGSGPARAAGRRPSVGWALGSPMVVIGGVGLSLGALNLLIVAYAAGHGRVGAVAWVEASLAVGSAIGGLAYGARSWGSQRAQLPLLAVALAVVISLAGWSPGIAVLAAAAGLAGLFVAPALTTAYLVADRFAAPEARTRASSWVNTAFNAGSSGGTAAVGLLIGRLPLPLCFAVAAMPLLLSAAGSLVPALLTRTEAEPVVADGGAVAGVADGAAVDRVVAAGVTVARVADGAAVDRVVAAGATDRVVAADGVADPVAVDRVVAAGVTDRVVAADGVADPVAVDRAVVDSLVADGVAVDRVTAV